MLDYMVLFFNCLCGNSFDAYDHVQPRFAADLRKLNELAKKRDLTYFNHLKKTIDSYRLLCNQPSINNLGLPENVRKDFALLREIALLAASRLGDTEKLRELCKKALEQKFPMNVLEQLVGERFDLDALDIKKAEQKLFSYVSLHGTDCVICQETFKKVDFLRKTIFCCPYGHFMHKECFKQWGKDCPVARCEFEYYKTERRWNNYLAKIEKKVQEYLADKNDPVESELIVLNSKPVLSDAEIARQLYEADLREQEGRLNQERDDEQLARNIID